MQNTWTRRNRKEKFTSGLAAHLCITVARERIAHLILVSGEDFDFFFTVQVPQSEGGVVG